MSQCIPKVVRNHLPDHLRPEDFTPTTTSNVFLHRPTSQSLLVKLATGKDAAQLVGEIRGLRAMARICPDLVPRIICSGTEVEQAWSITEWFTLQPSTSTDTQAELGRKLAQMHSRARDDTKDEKYGFDIPTHCGVTEQDNTWEKDWMTFFRDRRLGDLVNRIADNEISARWERMRELVIPALLKGFVPEPRPSIIHGDLWSGNVGVNKADGRPVIYDPSCYYGHNEVELGMTRMFGGFTDAFYEAYHRVHPRSQPHYPERQKLYELYHHLNHTLMFGGGYKGGALTIMKDLIGWANNNL